MDLLLHENLNRVVIIINIIIIHDFRKPFNCRATPSGKIRVVSLFKRNGGEYIA